MEWYQHWFGEEYLLVYEHRDYKEAAREVRAMSDIIGLQGGERVLDLCCGAGRHDITLAEMGCRVVGLDFSMPLLKIGMDARNPASDYPQYVRADARHIPFRDHAFDVVVNLFTSFGYFTDEENIQLIADMHRLLVPGGRFLIDYLNPPKVLDSLVERSERNADGLNIIEQRRYNADTHRVEKRIELSGDRYDQCFHESVRLYELEEMKQMIGRAGLAIDGVMGSMYGDSYDAAADRMVLYGTRPEAT